MAKDYANLPPTAIRRSDRQVTDEAWFKRLLHQEAVGTLATVHGGQPFINTNLFVYDEAAHAIYLHTAKKGRTRANVEQESKVCFSVFNMGRLLPASEALEFSVEYEGIVIFGRSRIIEEENEALSALQLIMDKYAPHLTPGVDYRPPVVQELKRTAVFKVAIDDWTGKKKEVAEDFPGAYLYHKG